MQQMQQQEMVHDGMDEVGKAWFTVGESELENEICSLIFVTAQCEH